MRGADKIYRQTDIRDGSSGSWQLSSQMHQKVDRTFFTGQSWALCAPVRDQNGVQLLNAVHTPSASSCDSVFFALTPQSCCRCQKKPWGVLIRQKWVVQQRAYVACVWNFSEILCTSNWISSQSAKSRNTSTLTYDSRTTALCVLLHRFRPKNGWNSESSISSADINSDLSVTCRHRVA